MAAAAGFWWVGGVARPPGSVLTLTTLTLILVLTLLLALLALRLVLASTTSTAPITPLRFPRLASPDGCYLLRLVVEVEGGLGLVKVLSDCCGTGDGGHRNLLR